MTIEFQRRRIMDHACELQAAIERLIDKLRERDAHPDAIRRLEAMSRGVKTIQRSAITLAAAYSARPALEPKESGDG